MSSWMSIIEYARQYNVSDMTVRRRIKTGRLNAELREGKYYIPVQESGQRKTFQEPEELDFQIDLSPTYNSQTAKFHKEPEPKEPRLRAVQNVPSSVSDLQLERISENFETAIDQIKQREELLKANFVSERQVFSEKYKVMDLEISKRNHEIESLRKEIDDLEMLVRILEAKKS